MFDPELDEDHATRRFYARLFTVVFISVVGCVALWPSVSGFAAGPDHNTGCLAITDGWHGDRSAPNLADIAFPPPPTRAVQNDPAALARWRVAWQASQARPIVQSAIAFEDWKMGPGACIRESRHRLIYSGIGLASLAAVCTGITLVRRTRTNLRRAPAIAGT